MAVDAMPHAGVTSFAGDDPQLTKRELEVLELMSTGDSNAEIAADLQICESTVKSHVKHIIGKLGVRNRTHAVSVYLRRP